MPIHAALKTVVDPILDDRHRVAAIAELRKPGVHANKWGGVDASPVIQMTAGAAELAADVVRQAVRSRCQQRTPPTDGGTQGTVRNLRVGGRWEAHDAVGPARGLAGARDVILGARELARAEHRS